MIRIQQLAVAQGDFRLGPIDLELERGSYLTVLGPSGAGKSVFLEACMGLVLPESGHVWIDGREATSLPPEQRQIAYLPQDLALFPHLTVRDNILFGSRRRQMDLHVAEARLNELVKLLDLDEVLSRSDVTTLSGGEQQRVALARALMPDPALLFLDEPHSALDAAIKRQLQVKLREINRELGVTILHVTHDQEEAFMLGERIAVMIGGTLRQVGGRDEIYYQPASLEVARFLRNQNIFDLQVAGIDQTSVRLVGELSICAPLFAGARPGLRVAAGIRCEEVVIIRPNKPLGPDLQNNLFDAMVIDLLAFGGTHTLCLALEGTDVKLDVELPNCAFRDLGYDIGDRLQVCLRQRSLWTLPMPGQMNNEGELSC
jgi:ABC-type Fe3+/spermidine/putrescine transport system ATPase subunit